MLVKILYTCRKSIVILTYFQICCGTDNCLYVGIVFQAYSPIGSPGRFDKHPDDPCVMQNHVVKEIASKHEATPAQVSVI